MVTLRYVCLNPTEITAIVMVHAAFYWAVATLFFINSFISLTPFIYLVSLLWLSCLRHVYHNNNNGTIIVIGWYKAQSPVHNMVQITFLVSRFEIVHRAKFAPTYTLLYTPFYNRFNLVTTMTYKKVLKSTNQQGNGLAEKKRSSIWFGWGSEHKP